MTSVKQLVGRAFAGFLNRSLTKDNKRMIFLTSLTAFIKDSKNPDDLVLEKLNELFSLSKDPNVLRGPMMLHPRIWDAFSMTDLRDKGITCTTLSKLEPQTMSMSQFRILANHLIRYAPEWLRYDSATNMRNDIYKLLRNTQALGPVKG